MIFSNMNSNCSKLLDMRNLQEQVEKALCYQKLFWINCSSDLKKQTKNLSKRNCPKNLDGNTVQKIWMGKTRKGRDRKTSMLVLAFWNFKLKVLKYQWNFRPNATVMSINYVISTSWQSRVGKGVRNRQF